MTQQATSTTTVRLLNSFKGDHGLLSEPVFHETTSNRIWQTLDGNHYVVTSWAEDPYYPQNAVVWESDSPDGRPSMEYLFRFTFDSENVPHFDGPDTDETHEGALAAIGYAVEQSEDEAA